MGATKVKGKRGRYDEVPPTTCEPLRHPLRVRILEVAINREISPVQFITEHLEPEGVVFKDEKNALSNVSYHFRELEKAGCIEVVKTVQRRGSVEHIYRGLTAVELNDEDFAALPAEQRRSLSRQGFQGLIAVVDGAMRADTFDSATERCMAWETMQVDRRGWKEMTTALAAVYGELAQIRDDSRARLEEGAEVATYATYSLLGFESPPPPLAPIN